MKIGQYRQRQRCKHVELEQFWQTFTSRGFVSDSWAFLLKVLLTTLLADLGLIHFSRTYFGTVSGHAYVTVLRPSSVCAKHIVV